MNMQPSAILKNTSLKYYDILIYLYSKIVHTFS